MTAAWSFVTQLREQFMFSDAIQSAAALVGLLIAIKDALRANRNPYDAGRIIGVLRLIYFQPNGIKSLLNEIAAGGEPSRERIQEALSSFNDREWDVRDALRELDFHTLMTRLYRSRMRARSTSYAWGRFRCAKTFKMRSTATDRGASGPTLMRSKLCLTE